ncbi:hypothetical protein [Streptomyces albidoflavus]|uniref:hypothetical protein n=1 Tax=Streptomyces albidoflavus TaxID=1886 RepID=UPI003451EF7C
MPGQQGPEQALPAAELQPTAEWADGPVRAQRRRYVAAVLFPLSTLVAVVGLMGAPMHKPEVRDMPVAVVGATEQQARQAVAGLEPGPGHRPRGDRAGHDRADAAGGAGLRRCGLPVSMVPDVFRTLQDVLPLPAAVDLARSLVYFDATGLGGNLLTIAAWGGAGLVLNLLADLWLAHRARQGKGIPAEVSRAGAPGRAAQADAEERQEEAALAGSAAAS